MVEVEFGSDLDLLASSSSLGPSWTLCVFLVEVEFGSDLDLLASWSSPQLIFGEVLELDLGSWLSLGPR